MSAVKFCLQYEWCRKCYISCFQSYRIRSKMSYIFVYKIQIITRRHVLNESNIEFQLISELKRINCRSKFVFKHSTARAFVLYDDSYRFCKRRHITIQYWITRFSPVSSFKRKRNYILYDVITIRIILTVSIYFHIR